MALALNECPKGLELGSVAEHRRTFGENEAIAGLSRPSARAACGMSELELQLCAAIAGNDNRLGARVDAEFFKDAREVVANGFLADGQLLCDFGITVS
jgi:hypothetical protein